MSGITITGGSLAIDMTSWGFFSQMLQANTTVAPTVQDTGEFAYKAAGFTSGAGPYFDINGSNLHYTTVDGRITLSSGTINTVSVSDSNHHLQFLITGLAISVSDFTSDMQLGNSGFQSALFGGGVTITGTAAGDHLIGYAGNDVISGGGGNDLINGGDGNNTLSGGDGDDTFVGAAGTNSIDGGTGNDTVDYGGLSAKLTIDLTRTGTQTFGAAHDHFTSIEKIIATQFNDTITGSSGNDVLVGNGGIDIFHLEAGGSDTVTGSGGCTAYVGGAWDATDVIKGVGKIFVDGDYSTLTTLDRTDMPDVGSIAFQPGHDYNFKFTGTTIPSNFHLDSSALGAGDNLRVDLSSITVPHAGDIGIDAQGGAGNDTFLGPNNVLNTYHLEGGGNDSVTGGTGQDRIFMGASYTAADTINGGASGDDNLRLDGDYSVNQLYTATNISSVVLAGGHSYNFTAGAGITEVDGALIVNGKALGAADALTFDGTAMTITLNARGGAGDDALTGGSGNDKFTLSDGGHDTVSGNGGKDTFTFGGAFEASDHVDGGAGNDTLDLTASSTTTLTLDAVSGNIHNVETLNLTGAQDFHVTVDAGYAGAITVTAGNNDLKTFTFDGHAFAGRETVSSYGNSTVTLGDGGSSVELLNTLAASTVTGGAGVDRIDVKGGTNTITGGDGSDVITLGGGTETVNGGTGNDQFFAHHGLDTITTGTGNDLVYLFASSPQGADFVTLTDFSSKDKIVFSLGETVTGIDATVNHGQLDNSGSEDTQLSAALGSLGAHHAIIFRPDSGSLAGHSYLVIDTNGTAGYQHGDYVVELSGTSTGALTTANFETLT